MICKYKNCNKTRIRARGLCANHWNLEQYGLCINGCSMAAANSHGYCSNCNKRGGKPDRRNIGSLINSDIERVCSRCKNIFPIEEFAQSHHKNRCVSCQNIMKKHSSLIAKYGISIDEWTEIVQKQGGGCAICHEISEKLCVDHDHSCCPAKNTCGKCIRGIICDRCNRALGLMRDNPEIFLSASKYLRKGR